MNLTRKNLLTLLFIVVSLAALVYTVSAAFNYDNYYWGARSDLLDPSNSAVNSVRVMNLSGVLTLTVAVSVTNPTDYSGLTVDSFETTVYFLQDSNSSQTIFASQQLPGSVKLSQPLGPRSTVPATLAIHLSANQSATLRIFNQTYPGHVMAHVLLTTIINSFLDLVFGRMVVMKEVEIPLS